MKGFHEIKKGINIIIIVHLQPVVATEELKKIITIKVFSVKNTMGHPNSFE